MKPIVFVDLDDTMFQTKAKCPPHVAESDLFIAATAKMGKHSYMTPSQKHLFDWLVETADLVPVTMRSLNAFNGIHVDFPAGAILANGQVIIGPDGEADANWTSIMNADLSTVAGTLKELLEQGRRSCASLGIDARSLIVGHDGVLGYVVFKDNAGSGERLAEIDFGMDLTGWTRHHNGNNLAIVPPSLSKKRAVQHFIDAARAAQPHRPVIGFGDSVTDIPFLQLCDMWGMPARSQIADRLVGASVAPIAEAA